MVEEQILWITKKEKSRLGRMGCNFRAKIFIHFSFWCKVEKRNTEKRRINPRKSEHMLDTVGLLGYFMFYAGIKLSVDSVL